MAKSAKPTGRPSSFTKAVGDAICARLCEGESLRAICRSEGMPPQGTVFRWLTSDKAFREQYAQAREVQADVLVDEILEISDDASNDWMIRHGKDGEETGWAVNGDHIQRSRLRVDSRKWFASKVAPKRYGEKVQTEITGADGGPVKFAALELVPVRPANADTKD